MHLWTSASQVEFLEQLPIEPAVQNRTMEWLGKAQEWPVSGFFIGVQARLIVTYCDFCDLLWPKFVTQNLRYFEK